MIEELFYLQSQKGSFSLSEGRVCINSMMMQYMGFLLNHIICSSRLLPRLFFVEKERQTDRLRMSFGECWRDLSLLLQLMTLSFWASFFLALE